LIVYYFDFIIKAEKYDEAKRLKQAISELYKIGERLARYDIEKRQAIEEEDYEKAKLKKQQMQEYRAETYRQLQMNNLLDFIDVSFFIYLL
jgi:centrosomal protein CEP104